MSWRPLDITTSYAVSVVRLGAGMYVHRLGNRPEKPLELYEFESCPYCRKVREALTLLDLPAMVYPCPKRGARFRPKLVERGGKAQFPYLIDPNTDDEMYESDDIVRHLFSTYGTTPPPLYLRFSALADFGSTMASIPRPGGGARVRPSLAPEKPLELYSFEASPYCRIAREALGELELPYLLHNVAKKSPSRKAFVKRSGKMMVPYLVDPNTNRSMFESAAIVRYLYETYGTK